MKKADKGALGASIEDVEMRDVSGPNPLEDHVADGQKVVHVESRRGKKDGAIIVPISGGDLPVPPAASANGTAPSLSSPKHQKSVSFGLGEAEVNSFLLAASGAEGGVGNESMSSFPPAPPATTGVLNGDITGANEAFLTNNFRFGGDSGQVRTLSHPLL